MRLTAPADPIAPIEALSRGTFICSKCNREFPHPQYVWASFFSFDRGRGWRYPVCPSGHALRSTVIGNMKPSSAAFGFFRGFGLSMLIAVMVTLRVTAMPHPNAQFTWWALACFSALLAGHGLVALYWAWTWIDRKGPVARLVPRSAGVAFGYLLTAFALWFGAYTGTIGSLVSYLLRNLH